MAKRSGTCRHHGYVGFWLLAVALLIESCPSPAQVQAHNRGPSSFDASLIPPVIKFSGVLREFDNSPRTSVARVTFGMFKDAEGGSPIWMETQNVQPDSTGRFTVFLGAMHSAGLRQDLFASGDARWIEITSPGLPTQSRAAMVSVPYAIKAADAQTLGGRPLSDFILVQHGMTAPNAGFRFCGPTPEARPFPPHSYPISLPIPVPSSGRSA